MHFNKHNADTEFLSTSKIPKDINENYRLKIR